MDSADNAKNRAGDGERTRTSLLRAVAGPEGGSRWDEFDRTYRPVMLGLARSAGLTHHDAEDVVQNAFATFLRGVHRFKVSAQSGSFRLYLRKIVTSRARDLLRAQRRRSHNVNDSPVQGENESKLDSAIAPQVMPETEFSALVEQAMRSVGQKINPRDLQILDLYFCKEWPAKQVAAVLNISESNVQQVASRNRRLLFREVIRRIN